jgi:cobalamin biosynthesis protein CbiG
MTGADGGMASVSGLVVGVGMRRGTEAASIVAAVREVVGDNEIWLLATVDRRAAEPGLRAAAAELAVEVVAFTPAELAAVDVPNPSAHSMATLGTPSVAEAAAILAGGPLLTPRRSIGGIVVATSAGKHATDAYPRP